MPYLKALLTSGLLVAVAEIGDKTQLLSFVLAARLPLKAIRYCAAGLFLATGALTLLGWPATLAGR